MFAQAVYESLSERERERGAKVKEEWQIITPEILEERRARGPLSCPFRNQTTCSCNLQTNAVAYGKYKLQVLQFRNETGPSSHC